MTIVFTAANSVFSTTDKGYSVTASDYVLLYSDAHVGSSASYGLDLRVYNSNHYVANYGQILSTVSTALFMTFNQSADYIQNYGSISGKTAGVALYGFTDYVYNAGQIYGGGIGYLLYGNGNSELANDGSIQGGNFGVYFSGIGVHLVNNYGQITGTTAIAGINSAGAERVNNYGAIKGNVTLGDGADIVRMFDAGYITGTTNLGTGIDQYFGGTRNDTVYGGSEADTLYGYGGGDSLYGESGADGIKGGAGTDIIRGGLDRDFLWGGDTTGANDGARDTFVFASLETGRTIGTADVIYDFVNGTAATADRIDLSLMDAKVDTIPNDAFAFIGAGAFTGVAGQLRSVVSGNWTYISGDTDGNRTADFYIDLSGAKTLAATDFIL